MSDLFLYNYCMVLSLHICLSVIHFHAEYQLAQTGKYTGLCVYTCLVSVVIKGGYMKCLWLCPLQLHAYLTTGS